MKLSNIFMVPWNHEGEPPENKKAEEFIKENSDKVAYVEEASVTKYTMKFYSVAAWLND